MQTIGTLAGGIAHDFNNILSAIFGYADMANKKINDTKQVSLNIQQIITAANRAKDIIEQIMIFSNRIKKKRIHVNLGSTIKEVISLIKVSIPAAIKII